MLGAQFYFHLQPRIDPVKLLGCLSILLSPNGGIKSQAEVMRLTSLMAKFSKKLVSKCIYIQILKSTDTELLCQFMGSGGWNLTHLWLQDAITTQNWPLVQEILELLLSCPVDVERLKTNTAPRLVKQLTKGNHAESVRILATKLVEQWLRVVRGETTQLNSNVQSENEASKDAVVEVVKDEENATEISDEAQEEDTSEEADENVEPEDNEEEVEEEEEPIKPAKKRGKVILKIMKKGKKMIVKASPTSESEKIPEVISEEVDPLLLDSVTESPETKSEEPIVLTETTSSSTIESTEDQTDSSKVEQSSQEKVEKKSSSSSKSKSSSRSNSSSRSKDSKSSSSSSSSKHKSSSSSKDKDKERERDKDKHRSSSKSSSSKSSSSSSRDKDKDKSRDKERHSKTSEKELQSHKDAKTLAEIAPESLKKLGVIGKIPKKPRDESASDKDLKSKPAPTAPRAKPTFSIEERDPEKRAKTVKTFNSKFRSHGLEEAEPPPPPVKKTGSGVKKSSSPPRSSTNTASTLNGSINSLKRSSPPHNTNKESAELSPTIKKIKLDDSNSVVTKSPKPKLHTLIETDMFSDALMASISKSSRDVAGKKRKRRPSETNDKKAPTTPTSPSASVPAAPLKFYQDTLSEDGKEGDLDTSISKDDKSTSESGAKLKKQKSTDETDPESIEEEPEEPPVKKAPGIGTGPDGPPGILKITRTKGRKKAITWKNQEDLVEIRFFELDETERVNVTKTFTDMRAKDLESEKMNLLKARKLQNDDIMQEKTLWSMLYEVDNVPAHPLGSNSKERKVQSDRERNVLSSFYYNRASVPDTPGEPDYELCAPTDPKIIPLEDITGNPDSVNDLRLVPWPEPRGEPPKLLDPHRTTSMSGFNSDFTRQMPPSIQPWANPPHSQPSLAPQIGGPPFVDPLHLAALNLPQLQLQNALPPQFLGAGAAFAQAANPMLLQGAMARPPPLLGPQINRPGPAMHDYNSVSGPPLAGPPPSSGPARSGPPPPQAHDWVRGRYAGRDRRWRDRDDRDDRDRGGICRNYQKYGNCKSAKCNYFHPR